MKARDNGRMPPPLAPSIEVLLAHERVVPAQPEMIRARALRRAREAPQEARARAADGPLLVRSRRLLFAAAALLTLLAGVAAAIQLMWKPRPDISDPPRLPAAPSSLTSASASPVLDPVASDQPERVNVPPAAQAVSVPKEPGANRSFVSADKHSSGMAELELLSRARQSDARAEYASVLTIAAEHERNFPAGRLSEEREVLRIKALVGLGRASEARQYAAKFRRQFPRSVLLSKLDGMLASLP